MSNIVERLRDRAYSFKAPDPLMEEAANEIERLRQERNHWMAAARAFDEHCRSRLKYGEPKNAVEELEEVRALVPHELTSLLN